MHRAPLVTIDKINCYSISEGQLCNVYQFQNVFLTNTSQVSLKNKAGDLSRSRDLLESCAVMTAVDCHENKHVGYRNRAESRNRATGKQFT